MVFGFPQVHPSIESRLGRVRFGTVGKMGRVHPGMGGRVEMTRFGGGAAASAGRLGLGFSFPFEAGSLSLRF